MACSCCSVGDTVEQHFTASKAAKDLQQYRRKGIGPTTRLLRDGLANAGLIEGALLDIGAGIDTLTFELLDRGISRAVVVEASSAYMAVCAKEAARRGGMRAVAVCSTHSAAELAGPHVIAAVRDYDELAHSNFLETLDAAAA